MSEDNNPDINSALAINSAKAAAESAATASKSAKTRAENAATASETAKGNAESAAATANIAKGTAESAATAANTAKGSAESAATASEAAKTRAENAATASETAKGNAESAATAAKGSAESAATAANTAIEAAESVTSESEEFQTRAADAATAAETAKKAAESAAAVAGGASDSALKASETANSKAELAAKALQLSTTTALAGAFNLKAKNAQNSQNIWAIVLVLALAAAVYIGALRFSSIVELSHELAKQGELFTALIIPVLLSILSIGAPVWLAWMASKMVSKYFYLSEDYAYKAATAAAYMGFKEQAEGLDPILGERLFAAAITQLDANPLRLFDSTNHAGSPLNDLMQQPFMQSVLENAKFKEELLGWFNRVFKTNFYVPNLGVFKKDTTPNKPSNT